MEHTDRVKELMEEWYELGFEAGKKDFNIDIERVIKDIVDDRFPVGPPNIYYVSNVIDDAVHHIRKYSGHYATKYKKFMLDDADSVYPDDIYASDDLFFELESKFWEGFLDGRASAGKDLKEFVKKVVRKFRRAGKVSRYLYKY
jgi:hypothetical protein